MYVLGLTGPMASGKSTVAQMFREAGAEVWDADVAVKHLYKAKSPVTRGLVAVLGDGILEENGAVDMRQLAALVRQNPAVLGEIEAVVFPALKPAWLKWVKRRKSPLLILEAPLLFEADLGGFCNRVVACVTPDAVRKERALARENVDAVWFDVIAGRQMETAGYVGRADVSLECEGMEKPQAFVERMWAKYGVQVDA